MKNINEIVKHLTSFKKIYVTGPQRSGTTFTAKYLSKMLNYKHIDEHDFGTHDFKKMLEIILNHDSFVVQCPAQSHNITNFPMNDDSIVVFMFRDIYDIISSEHRIDWHIRGAEKRERQKYNFFFEEYTKPFIPISVIKHKVWEQVQKPNIDNYLELNYNLLKDTDEWINKEDRVNFKNKQIK